MPRLSPRSHCIALATAVSLGCVLAQGCSRGDYSETILEPDPTTAPPESESFAPDGGADATGTGGQCATATVPIARPSIYMQIILDGSGSMLDPIAPGGPTGLKWKAARDAFVAFFDDVAAKKDLGFGVGLFLFDGTKGVPDFKIPDVPIRQVDAYHQTQLKNRITKASPAGGTPIKLSLEGQLPLLKVYTPSSPLKPNGKRILVLITDGVPDGPSDIQPAVQGACAKLVEDAFKGTPSITTFAVGVGDPASDESTYNEAFVGRLAVAGGAPAAGCSPAWNQSSPAGQLPCHVQITPGAKTAIQLRDELLAAINGIRGAAATCEFALERPDGSSAGVADPSRVNVTFTGSNGKGTTVLQDAADGWTYDNPTNPTAVIFHGAACDRVKTEAEGKVEIELGCKTLVK